MCVWGGGGGGGGNVGLRGLRVLCVIRWCVCIHVYVYLTSMSICFYACTCPHRMVYLVCQPH